MKLVNFTMPRTLEAKLSEAAKCAGVKKSEFVRNALCAAIEAQGIKILPEDLASNQGARNDLPNRITEAEKRASRGQVKRAKKEVSRLALALGKSRTRAEARSLADKAVRPGETI